MQEKLKIAGVQGHLAWENPIQNRNYFSDKIKDLEQDIDIIVLPEMFSTGFSMSPQDLAEIEPGDTLSWMKKEARNSSAAIAGSLMVNVKGNYYNRFYFVTPEGKVTHYDKRHRFTLAGEHKVYSSGKEAVIVNFKGWKLCLQVCYDLRFPVFSRNTSEYDALIYVANWPKIRIFAWDTLLKARAIENMAYCIGVNRIGLDGNGYDHNGHSGIYDSLGETLTFAGEKETVITATLSKEHLTTFRSKLNFLADRDQFELLIPAEVDPK